MKHNYSSSRLAGVSPDPRTIERRRRALEKELAEVQRRALALKEKYMELAKEAGMQ